MSQEITKADLIRAAKAEKCKRSLAYFVEQTTRDTWGKPIKLHSWQGEHFIPILGSRPSGRRIRFHAPPQYGKSIIMSKRFPLWLLVNDPMTRVVIVTYNEDFATAFYDALKSAVYEVSNVVPGFALTGNLSAGLVTPQRKALNDGTSSIVFATIGTGFTGKGCFIAGTLVATPSGDKPIESVCVGDVVYGYNLRDNQVVERKVIASSILSSQDIVNVNTEQGKAFTCTSNHPIFVKGRGYIEAGCLGEREEIVSLASDREVLQLSEEDRQQGDSLQIVQERANGYANASSMLHLREGSSQVRLRTTKGEDQGVEGNLLFSGVPERGLFAIAWRKVQNLFKGYAGSGGASVLLKGLPSEGCQSVAGYNLSSVQGHSCAEVIKNGLLRERLCEQCSCNQDARCEELQVQDGNKLCKVVSGDATDHHRAGIKRLLHVWRSRRDQVNQAQHKPNQVNARCSSHRSRPVKQHGGELDLPLQSLSHSVPQVKQSDRIKSVQRVHSEGVPVYDIQVEGTSNFFANGVLVHNCDVVIIDDPYRGLEDAMSPAYRKTVESFFDNKLFPRINEVTDIYLMYHAWAQGDIGDYAVEKYGFKEVSFPAVADGDPNDPTGREIGELLSPMREREHLEALEKADPKMYAAMFQGKPVADGDRPINTDGIKVLPVSDCPALTNWTRGFDTAYTSKTGSDNSGTLRAAFDAYGNIHLRGFRKGRVPLAQITDWALDIAKKDPPKTHQAVEMHNAGYAVADYLRRQPGFAPWVVNQRVSGQEGKLRVRLVEFYPLCDTARVYVYQEGDWQQFLDECEMFTGLVEGESDDLLAALAVILLAIKGQKSKYEETNIINRHAFRIGLGE